MAEKRSEGWAVMIGEKDLQISGNNMADVTAGWFDCFKTNSKKNADELAIQIKKLHGKKKATITLKDKYTPTGKSFPVVISGLKPHIESGARQYQSQAMIEKGIIHVECINGQVG